MSRLVSLLRNLRLAGGTAVEHFGDDPVVLALQISRRLRPRVLRPLLSAAAHMPGQGTLASLEAMLSGNKNRLEANLISCAQASAPAGRKLRMADLATAAGLPELAATLLAGVSPTARGRRGTAARLHWYNGDMNGAVRALDGGSARETAQQCRLAAEARVFAGWKPELAAVPGYQPHPQTVLHVLTNSLPHTQSGYAQRTHSLLKAQLDLGWDVHAVTRLGYPVQIGKLAAGDTDVINGVTYHRLLPARMPFGMDRRLQRQAEDMLALALVLRPAVLHTTTHFTNGLVTAAVADALGIPWVYEVRGQLADTWASTRSDDARSSQRYLDFKACEARVMNGASLVPTLGTAMAEEITAAGVDPAKLVLLPNAVGEYYLNEPLSPRDARRKLGLPQDPEIIGTVSSLVDYEGLDDLLRAFALLAPEHPQLTCLIAGDGSAAPGLKALAAELGINGRVLFPGRVSRENAHLYHQALDVFVVPRKDLNVTRAVTPLKPVEAMACRTPVVASSLPALRELVNDGDNGALAAPEDPSSLAASLDRLLADPSLRDRLGANGRAQVLATRTWHANAKLCLDKYDSLTVAA
ncbi:glycosyltransferase family 4 protein [Arthrobacter jiangjiafuii]|uniref:Glycosyltransferase family 4 protein n=1 Tax=Arthrobacter jiangjiafuii TaxID=2817475 RepID=A0A975M3A2_9MICC|nr:glycosyltransferase family 4 protein [Arthrobacter jiangjiafuii]MBP3043611.1 glycosyltransferase [Arthrobacter jiangjiafuii]QWC09120.1 glycosyltransferase family 4 protein [Arthrobacter jiangjiafuii]